MKQTITNFQSSYWQSQYNKALSRLERAVGAGRFAQFTQRKKAQLLNRLSRYARRLGLAMKPTLIAAGIAAGLTLATPSTAQTFTAQTGAANPFNGVDVGSYSTPTFVDIDNDGDKDAFIGVSNGSTFYYKNSPVLPVELVSFSGKYTEGGNLLMWATASEVNNKGFEVERSPQPPKGAFQTWETIGTLKAKGSNATYSFTDNAPLATTYYRLKQVDTDGKFDYSKVISLQSGQKGSVKVFPTLTRDVLTVEGARSFEIVNAAGQVVMKQTAPIHPSSFNIHHLQNGVYIVKGVNTEGGVFVEKIVKQ